MDNEKKTTENIPPERSRFLKWIVAIAIVIVLNLFFNFGFRVFYATPPQWNEFCDRETQAKELQQVRQEEPQKIEPDVFKECQDQYDAARAEHNRVAFIVLIILGMLALFASFYAKNREAISLGLSLGGVLSIVIGSLRYWGDIGDVGRLVLLAFALAALLWLGIKKFST